MSGCGNCFGIAVTAVGAGISGHAVRRAGRSRSGFRGIVVTCCGKHRRGERNRHSAFRVGEIAFAVGTVPVFNVACGGTGRCRSLRMDHIGMTAGFPDHRGIIGGRSASGIEINRFLAGRIGAELRRTGIITDRSGGIACILYDRSAAAERNCPLRSFFGVGVSGIKAVVAVVGHHQIHRICGAFQTQ